MAGTMRIDMESSRTNPFLEKGAGRRDLPAGTVTRWLLRSRRSNNLSHASRIVSLSVVATDASQASVAKFAGLSSAPAQRQRIKRAYKLQKPSTGLRMKRLQRMAHSVRPDHAALLHHRFARAQPALAILEIDGRQQALVER